MPNSFTITENAPDNGAINVTVAHGRAGRGVTKDYTVSLEDHAKLVALKDQIVTELAKEERLPAEKTAAPIYAALLELNDRGPMPRTDKKIGLLKRSVIHGNLDNPAHVAKAIVNSVDRASTHAERVARSKDISCGLDI